MNYLIDRFEENYAVLECEDRSFIQIRKDKLPEQAEEGDELKEDNGRYFLVDNTKQRERIRRKMESLFEK